MPSYAVTREADHDIAEIEDYTSTRWGDDQAERYVAVLYAAFESLCDNPMRGRRRPDIPPPYLTLAIGSHLIIYRINTADDRIEILNILHPAMDIARRLKAALQRRP